MEQITLKTRKSFFTTSLWHFSVLLSFLEYYFNSQKFLGVISKQKMPKIEKTQKLAFCLLNVSLL